MVESLKHRGLMTLACGLRRRLAEATEDWRSGIYHRRAIEPMSDAGRRVTVTSNGEIYNDRLLRSELEQQFGFTFAPHATGTSPWGDALFDRLEGMFAIALWDSQARKLVLTRESSRFTPSSLLAKSKRFLPFLATLVQSIRSYFVGLSTKAECTRRDAPRW